MCSRRGLWIPYQSHQSLTLVSKKKEKGDRNQLTCLDIQTLARTWNKDKILRSRPKPDRIGTSPKKRVQLVELESSTSTQRSNLNLQLKINKPLPKMTEIVSGGKLHLTTCSKPCYLNGVSHDKAEERVKLEGIHKPDKKTRKENPGLPPYQ